MQLKMFESSTLSESQISTVVDEVSTRLGDINFVSFSGGKDSTVVLQLVFLALQKFSSKKLYIVTSDTLMEIPYFISYVNSVRQKIKRFIDVSGLNVEVVTVKPKLKNSFWVSVIGKGYPAASMGFRWCTGRLKIEPIQDFTRSIVNAEKNYMVFVGVRRAESALRARIYKRRDFKACHFAPILHWSSYDVWEYLLTEPCVWGGDHGQLLNVYKYSSDECVYGEKQGVCVGNARYGCWACPLQKSSQLDMIGAHTGDRIRYGLLRQFKESLVGMAADHRLRSEIRRNGDDGVGPFLVEVRKEIFSDLKKLEQDTGWTLITQEEEFYIKKHWEVDSEIHNKSAFKEKAQELFDCFYAPETNDKEDTHD